MNNFKLLCLISRINYHGIILLFFSAMLLTYLHLIVACYLVLLNLAVLFHCVI